MTKKSKPVIALKDVQIPDEIKNSTLSREEQLELLNLVLGNYLDIVTPDKLLWQRPSDVTDSGTGTLDLGLYRFIYEDEVKIEGFWFEFGLMMVDLRTGETSEPDFYESVESFETFQEAYQYASWLLLNEKAK